MHRTGHDNRRASAGILLTLFVVGGLLGPVVHRAHHGLAWAKLHAETADSCDHTDHSDGFEATFPDFLDDDCLLCIRHLADLDGTQAAPTAYHGLSGYVLPVQAAPQTPHFTLFPIRGPPGVS